MVRGGKLKAGKTKTAKARSRKPARKAAPAPSKKARDPLQPYVGPERRKPILIVQHAPHEHPAAVRRALESQGVQSLCIHPYRGEAYPNVADIGGMISLGGPMGANDVKDHPWIERECELLRECVEADYPTVGICLGGQMMAKALGGRVEKHHTAEVGWFQIEVNEAGLEDPIMSAAGQKPVVYQWHGDTFHPPYGAVHLASSRACARQAYRFGDKAYGFQFHPEADHQLVLEWLAIDGVENEIEDVLKEFGPECVQAAHTQRHHALQGEIGSLKITSAIASLFRRRPPGGTDPKLPGRLRAWLKAKATILVRFEGSHRRTAQLRGLVLSLISIPAGEYMVFQEDNAMLWPIRLEDVISAEEEEAL